MSWGGDVDKEPTKLRLSLLFTFAIVAAGELLQSSGLARPGSVAASQQQPAELGWGQVRDGLQARLGIDGGRLTFNLGESVRFTLTLRAVGSEHVSLRMRAHRDWSVGLVSGNVLSLTPLPGDVIDVQLEPGGEQEFAGPVVFLCPVGIIIDSKNGVPLLPGRYMIRADTPFYVQDPTDSRRGIGLRAEPGTLEIEVNESPGGKSPRLLPEHRLHSRPGTAWGEVAGGLQAGLALADGPNCFKRGQIVASTFLVRNVIDTPIGFSYRTYYEFDWSPEIDDLQGKPQQVRSTDVLGWRVQKSVLLQPGEIVEIGQPVLALGVDLRSGSTLGPPTLYAPPGRYVMSESLSVIPEGTPTRRSVVVLESGKLSFTIAGEQIRDTPSAPKP